MKKRIKPTVLVILDGVGINKKKEHNAVQLAKTPHIDYLMQKYPHCSLQASGKAVGLLQGDIGNSEVGHLTLGAGRVIQQPVSIIHEAIKNNFFFENSPLKNCLKNIKQSNGNLHIMGLLSDASVHSHIDHLQAFLKAAQQANIKQVFIHPFLDGRDTPPQSAKIYLDKLEKIIKKVGIGTIASIHGRFYAMDRNNNWQRTQKSYDVLTKKQNSFNASWKKILQEQYKNKITDEFIPPTQLNPNGIIQENDSIIFFNFRPDRARQLTTAFIKKTFTTFPIKKIHLNCFITPTKYADNLKTTILFKKEPIKNCLPEIFHLNKKRFFAIAEKEKYAHVTYFFSGGREKKLPNETRKIIQSIETENYAHHPKMSAEKITTEVIHSLQTDVHDFYLINYANADMVGHTGNIQATVEAIEYLDKELQKLYNIVVKKMNGILFVTADHGNAENMFNPIANQPQTAHTTNPVPFIYCSQNKKGSSEELPLDQLADVAPFILEQMNIDSPKEMN